MKILIDGDREVYKAAWVSEKVIEWEPDMMSVACDAKEARQRMEISMELIRKKLSEWLKTNCELVVVFSGEDNWRKKIYPEYKAGRVRKLKPLAFKPLKEWFLKNYDAKIEYGLEADDLIGILATTDENDTIMVSDDKDFKNIPGWLYNPDKMDHPKLTTLEDANYNHMLQTLTGDAVDGYPGLPSYGPVKASKALGPREGSIVPELWERVIKAYGASGFPESYATIQSKLARILRKGEWDYEKKECLWEPPTILDGTP